MDIVAEVVGWLNSGSDVSNAAQVQRSWRHPAQAKLFGTVTLKCPLRAQLFVEAFVRNIGPGNPCWHMGADRLRLECFVRHIYIDVPENYSQVRFYTNLTTILPLLSNLRSLYIMMRRWSDHVWRIELGKYLPEHAPPSLERLCIQVSKYFATRRSVVLINSSQLPAGDPDARAFMRMPDVMQWKVWFGAWSHLQSFAFVCEDIWGIRSSQTTASRAAEEVEGIVCKWLVDSSLKSFDIWSGVDSIHLSQHFQIASATFHNIPNAGSARHQYSFKHNEYSHTWTLSPPTAPMHSAALQFCRRICTDGCWICLAIEHMEDVDNLISYLDDVREGDWHDRMIGSKPWSTLECDPTYNC